MRTRRCARPGRPSRSTRWTWKRDLAGHPTECDARTRLDVADEHAAAGAHDDALRLVDTACEGAHAASSQRWSGIAPLARDPRAAPLDALARPAEAAAARRAPSAADRDRCSPAV